MTVTQLINSAGLTLKRHEKIQIGLSIRDLAKEHKVKSTKVDEIIRVSDYPADFVPVMEKVIIDYLQNKK